MAGGPFRLFLFLNVKFCVYFFIFLDRSFIEYGVLGFVFYYFGIVLVPDLETVNFTVLSRTEQYEIREVEVCSHFNVFLYSAF